MLACLRSRGLAARYISGYLLTAAILLASAPVMAATAAEPATRSHGNYSFSKDRTGEEDRRLKREDIESAPGIRIL